MPERPNLILIICDTLRADCLDCYGDQQTDTPHLDAFAAEAAVFTAAYPEALPTIPVRRALHTGRRTFPFRESWTLRWDIVKLPGWHPMAHAEDTVAEHLAHAGYYTGFVTDTLPYFAPGMNFTRGFWQWEFVRGQQQDRWRSPATASREALARYGDPDEFLRRFPDDIVLYHVANTAHVQSEEQTSTAEVFRWASRFVEDNRHVMPFYLLVDCFKPHEPWEAPRSYYERYADPDYSGPTMVHRGYGPFHGTDAEIDDLKAHYRGLVSLVDRWFGHFVDTLKRLALYDRSVIVVTSDHGTNLGDTPGRVVGKPASAMYPGVMHTPLLVRFPDGAGARHRLTQLVYNLDITATLCARAGISTLQLDGQDLHTLVAGQGWRTREYLTCRYGNELWYRDQRYWAMLTLDGKLRGVFDLGRDAQCQRDLSAVASDVTARAWDRLLTDAGGTLPDYRGHPATDAIGQPVRSPSRFAAARSRARQPTCFEGLTETVDERRS